MLNRGNHFAWCGDGNTLQILKKEKYTDDDGIVKYKFMFIASQMAISMYGMQMDKELKYLPFLDSRPLY